VPTSAIGDDVELSVVAADCMKYLRSAARSRSNHRPTALRGMARREKCRAAKGMPQRECELPKLWLAFGKRFVALRTFVFGRALGLQLFGNEDVLIAFLFEYTGRNDFGLIAECVRQRAHIGHRHFFAFALQHERGVRLLIDDLLFDRAWLDPAVDLHFFAFVLIGGSHEFIDHFVWLREIASSHAKTGG